MIFWILAGLGFGYWATEEIGGILKNIYMTGYDYEWLFELYMYCLTNGFFAMVITGLPFYLVAIWCSVQYQRYGTP